jgi:hypothetical protein
MRSLRRRKVDIYLSLFLRVLSNIFIKAKQGIVSESVKSINAEILQELYVYNAHQAANTRLQRLSSTKDGARIWGGYRKRIMMQLIYAISFQCFLRIDETLRIETRHIRVINARRGQIELTLDYRKTAQEGGRYFRLYNTTNAVFQILSHSYSGLIDQNHG